MKNKNYFKVGILVIVLILIFASILNSSKLKIAFEVFAIYLYPDNQNRNGELFKIVLSVFGAFGILFGLYASWKRAIAMENGVLRQKDALEIQSEQIAISRKAQTDERFKNAVEHLGDEREPIILGGIAELDQIAKENKLQYSEIVFNIFCSYIRTSANLYTKTAEDINTTVIQTIINNLFKVKNNSSSIYLGLDADLSCTNLNSIDLDFTDLSGVNLSLCYMPNLKNSNLENANLGGAVFTVSNINNVSFVGANLSRTLFYSSTIKKADMSNNTDLTSTFFLDSELTDINFNNNSISICKFIACDLYNSSFQKSNILGSSFNGTGLKNIDFSNVKLFGKNDFRATGFMNVNINTIMTSTKFNGCIKGGSYRHSLIKNLQTNLGKKADLSGITINNSVMSNCDMGEFLKEDLDEVVNEYCKCKELSRIGKSKLNKPPGIEF